MKKGDLYKGFRVKEILEIEDTASTGIFLVHERTGMEVFHLLNSDTENLFCFAFRTPSKNSSGVAHIIEHSVLCGSKNYPLKDPFVRLTNQSINTYLNALTSTDKTMFPAASTVKADYFNLMGVYADAVFFPLLTKETFLQEGHRIEFDKNGKPEIQGVVYNEMKGAYSSFDNVADDEISKVIHTGTPYAFDSGGDPVEIPYLSYEDFKSFYKEHYCAANCMLFLYGNIPTEEQLDFVDEKILRFISNPGKKVFMPEYPLSKTQHFVKVYGPDDSDETYENSSLQKQVAVVAWKINPCVKKGEFAPLSMQIMFISDLLFGDDSAPVAKALLESKLGNDLALQNGYNLNTNFYSLTFGLSGVDEKNVQAVEKLIFEVLEEVFKNGVDEMDLKRTCLDFEFMNREIKRFHSPYSMVYMRKVFSCWAYGENPWEKLLFKKQFEDFKNQILENQDYLKSLIKKYFLDNKNYSLIFASPSKKWSETRRLQEEKNAIHLLEKCGREKLLEELSLLEKNKNLDEKKYENLIPHVKISDVDFTPEKLELKKSFVRNLPFSLCEQNANGIIYLTMAFPVDILPPQDYVYLNLLSAIIGDVGWGNLAWNEALRLLQTKCGGFSNYVRSANPAADFATEALEKNPLTKGRDLLVFNMKCLAEDFGDAVSLLADCIFKTDFSDLERLSSVVKSYYASSVSSVNSMAHTLSYYRASSKLNRFCAQREIFEGFSSLCYLKEQKEMDIKLLSKKLLSLLEKIRNGGCMIYAVGDGANLKNLKPQLENIADKYKIKKIEAKLDSSDEEFFKLTDICEKYAVNAEPKSAENQQAKISENKILHKADEIFIIPGTVGYACSLVSSQKKFGKESVADEVLAHCLSTSDLWNKIRVEGGAYGVFFSPRRLNGVSSFITYRDPKPFASLEAFNELIKSLATKKFDEETVEKAVSGIFSDEIEPKVPYQKGMLAISYDWNGYPENFEEKYLEYLKEIRAEDIKLSAKRFSQSSEQGKTVILCSKSILNTKNLKKDGKIIQLAL